MQWDGVKPEQYESLRKSVNWEGNKPDGAVFHIAAFTPTGIRVTDVWESEKDFNNFVENRLMPEVKKIGVDGEPKVEFYPMHAMFAPAFVEK